MAREPDNNSWMTRRISAFFILVGLILFALTGRLWQLQVIKGDEYEQMAVGNRMRYVRIAAPRGVIYDRNGEPLAENRISFTASIDPRNLPGDPVERRAGLEELGRLIDMTPGEIERALTGSPHENPYEPIRVKRDLAPTELVALEEHRAEFPSLVIEQEPVRRYPHGTLASHWIGYLGPISAEELADSSARAYRGTDFIGKSGLERTYEDVLRGQGGSQQLEVNVFNRRVQVLGRQEPVPGADLALTMDVDLQEASTRALEEALSELAAAEAEAGEAPVDRGGSIVAIDPRTGELLAMVSLPHYDPNKLLGSDRSDYYSDLAADPALPLVHRAIRGEYSPGSTFKVVTAAAALTNRVIDPDELFFADDVAPHGKRDWTLRFDPPLPPHGWLDMYRALEVSCNDYFWELGIRLGIDRLHDMGRAFGVGSPTGVRIFPEEEVGLMPDPAWKDRAYAGLPASERRWYEAETMDVSIGQGAVLTTPLQMATIYMAVANGGTIYRPQLVKSITSASGETLFSLTPEVVREVPVADSDWQTIRKGLVEVTTGNEGTGRRHFQDSPIPVAGKTGTTQLAPGKGHAHAWFAWYAPADDPEIVVVVMVEHGDRESSSAVPVARRVFDAYFAPRLESEPDGEGGNTHNSEQREE